MKDICIYISKVGQTQVEVSFSDDSVWLSQAQMAKLFNQTKQNVSLHINYCFKETELSQKATVKEPFTVQKEGGRQITRKCVSSAPLEWLDTVV
jgi:hypothetical protein